MYGRHLEHADGFFLSYIVRLPPGFTVNVDADGAFSPEKSGPP